MTTIFDTFEVAKKDKIAVSTFLEACQRENTTYTSITIAIAIYGPRGCGKTTLALNFAQCPPIRTASSSKTGEITAVVIPSKAKPVRLEIFDILDSPVNFILTDCFAILIDGEEPNFNYVDKIAAQAFAHQRAVIVISKTDLLDPKQFKNALVAAAQAKKLLERKVTSVHVIPAKLTEDASHGWINSLLFEYYMHCRAISLDRELKETQRQLYDAEYVNRQNLASRTVASTDKRSMRLESSLVGQLFDLSDAKMSSILNPVLMDPDYSLKNSIQLMEPPPFDANSSVQNIVAENEKTRTLSDLLHTEADIELLPDQEPHPEPEQEDQNDDAIVSE